MPGRGRTTGREAANDFNNILQVIGGSAELLLQGLDARDPRATAAKTILRATREASALARALARPGGPRGQLRLLSWDVSAVIGESLGELRRRVHPGVQLQAHLSRRLPRVHVDRSHLREVLLQLVDHAAAAMPAGGTLTLVTDAVNVGPRMQQTRPWLRAGRFVRLEVADSSPGVDPTTLEHLFEPASTYAVRSASHVDLPALYSLVKQHGGFIWASSEPRQGTRVTVLFPAARSMPATDDQPATRGHVLLVEDDEGVRELVDGVLLQNGFSVAAYGSAEAALHHEGPFDLLLTDVGLPGLDGPGLARAIKRRTPAVPVLLMSADCERLDGIDELTPTAFLHKPFSSKALVDHVEQLLLSA